MSWDVKGLAGDLGHSRLVSLRACALFILNYWAFVTTNACMIVNVLRYWFGTLSSGSRAAVLDEVYFSSPAFSWSVHIFFGHILPMKWLTDASSLSLISGRQTLSQVVGGRWLAFWVTLKQKTSSLCTAHPSNPNKNRGERRLFTGYKRNNIQKIIVIQWYSYGNSDSPGNDYCLRVNNRPPQPDFMYKLLSVYFHTTNHLARRSNWE